MAARTAEVRGEIARADAKASGLATLATLAASAGTAGLVTAGLPLAAVVVGWAAVAAVAGACAVLLLAMRPVLRRAACGPLAWSAYRPAKLVRRFEQAGSTPEHHARKLAEAQQLQALSKMAWKKFTLVRLAGDVLLAGIGLGATAVVLALLTGL